MGKSNNYVKTNKLRCRDISYKETFDYSNCGNETTLMGVT